MSAVPALVILVALVVCAVSMILFLCLSVRLTQAHTCATWCHQAISFAIQHREHLWQEGLVGGEGGGGGGERGGVGMAEEFKEKDDQAQAVHPHKVVEVFIVFLHLRSGTCLVDLMQT